MAQWKVGYQLPNGNKDWLYLHAADSKSMKMKDHNIATRNAAKRAKERLTKKGVGPVRVFEVVCVG